jgi:hypothetical protein
VRNNPWISRGIKSWEAKEIGCGITIKSAASDDEFRKRADELVDVEELAERRSRLIKPKLLSAAPG